MPGSARRTRRSQEIMVPQSTGEGKEVNRRTTNEVFAEQWSQGRIGGKEAVLSLSVPKVLEVFQIFGSTRRFFILDQGVEADKLYGYLRILIHQ